MTCLHETVNKSWQSETKKDKKIKEQNQEIMELRKELAKLKGTKATKKTAPIELNVFDDEDGTDLF